MSRLGPRTLASLPFAYVAIATVALAASGPSARATVLAVAIELAKGAALFGLGAAALAFERGDYLRRGWGLSAICYLLLLVRDASLFAHPAHDVAALEVARAALIVAANGALVVGTFSLARAWRVAGLDFTASPALRRTLMALAIAAAVSFAGPSLVVDVRAAIADVRRAWTVFSDLGDMLALPLLVPVALTAMAVQGGILRWAWALLSASLLAWLLYDALLTLPEVLKLAAEPTAAFRWAGECFRLLAAACACAAGLAQRRAVILDDDGDA